MKALQEQAEKWWNSWTTGMDVSDIVYVGEHGDYHGFKEEGFFKAMAAFHKHALNEKAKKIKDSFDSLANEYMVSERWREHFAEILNEYK